MSDPQPPARPNTESIPLSGRTVTRSLDGVRHWREPRIVGSDAHSESTQDLSHGPIRVDLSDPRRPTPSCFPAPRHGRRLDPSSVPQPPVDTVCGRSVRPPYSRDTQVQVGGRDTVGEPDEETRWYQHKHRRRITRVACNPRHSDHVTSRQTNLTSRGTLKTN